MRKKAIPGKKEPPADSFVGKGYKKRRFVHVPPGKFLNDPDFQGYGFDRLARTAETWSKSILEHAGIPANGDQLPRVEELGLREFEDEEWIAATILYCLSWVRHYEIKATSGKLAGSDFKHALTYASRVGGLFRDMRVNELSKGYGKGAPHPSTSDPVITRRVKSRYRANPVGLTLAGLRAELENTDAFDDAIRIGRAKMYLSGQTIKIFENGTERKLAFTSLRRYLTETRKNSKTR